MFRPSDQRRVQASFDAALPAPYEAQVTLLDERRSLAVTIMDPDEPSLPVANAVWWYDPALKNAKQPADAEIAAISAQMQRDCEEYPARKAAEALELAERMQRQQANAEARFGDTQARLEAERRLKSVMGSALATSPLTQDKIAAVEAAVTDPRLD